MIQKILIAPDKFKGSLSGAQICHILKDEILSKIPDVVIEECPMADGGDGSVEILSHYLDLEKRTCNTVDPVGKPIEAVYYTSDDFAYIELATSSGLILLDDSKRNPLHTSTFGTGIQIKNAIDQNIENIFLFLGGSATNDGGMGIASALGYRFLDGEGQELKPTGSSLKLVDKIIPPLDPINIKSFTLCCDVKNVPFGKNGAAHIYAKQKGANQAEIFALDQGLENLCNKVNKYNGIDLSQLIGGGAAGGVPICLVGLMKGQIISGIDFFKEVTDLENKIANSDLVISGEGRLDSQSLDGKVVSGVAALCRKHYKKLWLVVGKNDLSKREVEELGVEKVFSVMDFAEDIVDAISNARKYVKEIGSKLTKCLNG